jgi:tetratricopeptide (TPR) repeat protein
VESIARPMRRLQEDASWFARSPELKLLHVRTDATLRGAVLDMLMSQESHADNRAVFFRFEDPASGPDRGWATRAARLRAQWADKTEAVAPADIHLRPLGDGAERAGGADFAATLLRATQRLAPPLTQLVVVLAPAQVEDAAMFLREVSSLVAARELVAVRWVVVEVDGAAVAPLVAQLDRTALGCLCLVDEKEQQDDLAALGAAEVGAPPAIVPPPAWRAAGAMPDVEPPPRRDLPRRATDEELRAEGLSPMFVNGGADALKKLVLGAALALRKGKHADAVNLQARAAELCAAMQMPREQVLNLYVLGGYLLAGQVRARAREVYARAVELARAGAFPDLEAQGELGLGMLEALERRPAEAAAHYAAAGRLAEAAKAEPLAIECWRLAGQLALDAGLESSAVECWKRALTLAEPLEPDVAKVTSSAEAARALAALCRKRGLVAQAQALEQQSAALDAGKAAPEATT